MRWRRRITAETLEGLRAAAEEQFPPGTVYAIDVITEEGLTGVRTRYRAEALTAGTGAPRRTPLVRRGPAKPPRPGQGIDPPSASTIAQWRPKPIPREATLEGPRRAVAFSLLHDSDGETRFGTDDADLEALLERLAPEAEPAGAHGRDGLGRRRPAVALTVYAGLLDDPIQAAEQCREQHWTAAGALAGGEPGASVVCYGLGDGSEIARLAEGLHRYRPFKLVLAVDPSRKHADTLAWVSRVAAVAEVELVVAVARAATATPGTVRELGYPVRALR